MCESFYLLNNSKIVEGCVYRLANYRVETFTTFVHVQGTCTYMLRKEMLTKFTLWFMITVYAGKQESISFLKCCLPIVLLPIIQQAATHVLVHYSWQ